MANNNTEWYVLVILRNVKRYKINMQSANPATNIKGWVESFQKTEFID